MYLRSKKFWLSKTEVSIKTKDVSRDIFVVMIKVRIHSIRTIVLIVWYVFRNTAGYNYWFTGFNVDHIEIDEQWRGLGLDFIIKENFRFEELLQRITRITELMKPWRKRIRYGFHIFGANKICKLKIIRSAGNSWSHSRQCQWGSRRNSWPTGWCC